MGEVAEMFDVKPSLIRFWEKKFDILKPHKNKKGNRMFTPEDVDNFRMIYHLVKEKGMTLEGARLKMKGQSGEELTRNMEIIDRLQAVKALLMEVKQSLKVGDGLPDEYWDRDDEPLIGVTEEGTEAETLAAGPAEEDIAVPASEPSEESPWIEEPAPVAETPVEEPDTEEPEDDEFGFGRREEDIPDPFEYEPADDYAEEQPMDTEPTTPADPDPAAETPAPKPRRKRAAKSPNTIRLDDDDAAEQAPKPRFIEQTLF